MSMRKYVCMCVCGVCGVCGGCLCLVRPNGNYKLANLYIVRIYQEKQLQIQNT